MSGKGKNYTAAEKHFIKKQEQYTATIRRLEETVASLRAIVTDLTDENFKLLNENEQLHEWIERLLSYTELSLDDIKEACKKDKEGATALKMFNTIMGMAGGLSFLR